MAMKPKSTRFLGTEAERRVRRLTVIGYKDLRPIDWFTGKRVPLAKGEGNICDRCGAEHAIVFTLRDLDSNEEWKVGSGCAKRSFGFDPEKDVEAKRLMKEADREAERRRVKELEAIIERHTADLVKVVGAIPMPAARLMESKPFPGYEGAKPRVSEKWGMGDATVWRHNVFAGEPLSGERSQTLMQLWAEKRAIEHAPAELKRASDNGHTLRKVASMVSWRLVSA